MSTIFTKIIKGEIPSYKIAENAKFYAFLDINPLAEGHTLVVPKQETDYYFDLDEQTMAEINIFAQKIAKAIDKAIECKRVGVLVVGTEVPHAHLHLIPFKDESQMSIKSPKIELSKEKFEQIAQKIKKELSP